MEEPNVKKFLFSVLISIGIGFFIPIAVLSLILSLLLKTRLAWSGMLWVVIGNIFIYCLTSVLYYWKAYEAKDKKLTQYLEKKFSLRPISGFIEISFFTFFLFFRPEIIVGYLVVRGIAGYRGDKSNDQNLKECLNGAQITGEYSSISKIGTILALFISVVAVAMFKSVFMDSINQYFTFLNK